MISPSLVAGLVVVAAAAVAVIVRDGRAVAGGVLVALLVSPFATSPVPGALQIAARFVAALLAAYVLWVTIKSGAVKSDGTGIGPIAEIAVAAGAYALGWWLQPVSPLQAPLSEQASGFALVALAVLPLAGSGVFRAGVGVLFVTLGVGFVMDAWLGAMPALGQLTLTALLLTIPVATSLLLDSDDLLAKVTPALSKIRPERPNRPERPSGSPLPGGEGAIELAPRASRGAGVTMRLRTAAAKPGEVADRESEAESSEEAPAGPAAEGKSPEIPAEPTTHVTGPRPSVRFLGRNAPIRNPSDASQARRPGERHFPGLGRRHAPGTPEETDANGRPGSDEPGDDASGIRDLRGPRDPRGKRPLR